MIGNLLKPELTDFIQRREFNRLREVLCGFATPEIAEILTDFAPEEQAVLLRILPQQLAADVFEHLGHDIQERLLLALGNEQVAAILNEMEPDDRTALLEELPAALTRKLLDLLSPQERKTAVTLLGYPEDSVGRRMTPEYVAVQQEWKVLDALAHLRRVGPHRETFNHLFVVDMQGKLAGVLRLRNLVVAEFDVPISRLLEPQVIALRAGDDQETAIATFQKYDRTAIPVTDSEGVLVGVVTVDDVLDVVEEEATEDMQKMGGMQSLDTPYLETGLVALIRKRAGWLVLLFLGQMLTATAMARYEADLANALVLALFIPLIISSGGNSGAQASTLIIRAMATRDVAMSDFLRVFRRELAAGLALGLVLAVIGFLRVGLWPNSQQLYTDHYLLVATVVSVSLIGVVTLGSLVGAMLPFGLRKLKLDPATCSAPFVATLVDVTGLIIYFSVAQIVLRGSLL